MHILLALLASLALLVPGTGVVAAGMLDRDSASATPNGEISDRDWNDRDDSLDDDRFEIDDRFELDFDDDRMEFEVRERPNAPSFDDVVSDVNRNDSQRTTAPTTQDTQTQQNQNTQNQNTQQQDTQTQQNQTQPNRQQNRTTQTPDNQTQGTIVIRHH